MPTPVNAPASLDWVQAADGGWDLRDAHAHLAHVAPGNRAWIATTAEEAYTVQRVGFHRPRVVVRPMGALAEIAHVQHDWRGLGTLCLASGPCYEIDRVPGAGLAVRDAVGQPVVRLTWTAQGHTARAQLLSPEATGRFGLVILMVAGYLLVDDLGDPSRPRSVGFVGPTVRSRFV